MLEGKVVTTKESRNLVPALKIPTVGLRGWGAMEQEKGSMAFHMVMISKMAPKAQATKEKIDKLDLIKI